jgi:hypothetical protein
MASNMFVAESRAYASQSILLITDTIEYESIYFI